MSDIAIRVENLSKSYQITHSGARGKYKTLQEDVIGFLKRPFSRGADGPRRETFWALKDISFEVKHGEVLGIIGRNGAGKSTLLKILSRITKPTSGYAEIYGRVGSLLEVGTGFHPELTGRENIFLNGAVLGMSRRDIMKHFDEIVAFADVEQFLDTPAKRYSSGMYMRLAFAVAAHLEPEVLVVDEVLAVGDAEFQKKCLGKMSEVAKSGRTILFVSHNMAAVESLCSQAVLLSRGKIAYRGEPGDIIANYTKSQSEAANITTVSFAKKDDISAQITCLRLTRVDGLEFTRVLSSDAICLEVSYSVYEPAIVLNLSISVYASDGTYVLASPSITDTNWSFKPHEVGEYIARCVFPAPFFNKGFYSASVLLIENSSYILEQRDQAITIEIDDDPVLLSGYYGYWGGVVRPILEWSTLKV